MPPLSGPCETRELTKRTGYSDGAGVDIRPRQRHQLAKMESILVPDLEAGHLSAGRICATRPSAASNIACTSS
jgi:hypothetical protein